MHPDGGFLKSHLLLLRIINLSDFYILVFLCFLYMMKKKNLFISILEWIIVVV